MSTKHSVTMPRGIDHLVIAGADLERLAETYRGLGFQVGPRNVHPWGTANHIVQFNGTFLELIGVAAPGSIPAHAGRQFSFGAFVRDYIAGGDGFAMLAVRSNNAIADTEEFRKARIGDYEHFYFERIGKGAEGQDVRVSFTLAFAGIQAHPRAGFFTCQQHQPQNFWNPARQIHENGTTGIASVILVADDPADEHEFLDAFLNQREMRATSFGIELDAGNGLVEVLSPEAFAYRFGEEPNIVAGQGTQFAAIEFSVTSPSLPAGARQQGELRVIPAAQAGGVTLAFRS